MKNSWKDVLMFVYVISVLAIMSAVAGHVVGPFGGGYSSRRA